MSLIADGPLDGASPEEELHERQLQERIDDAAAGETHRLRSSVTSLIVLIVLAAALVLAVPGLNGVERRIAEVGAGWLVLATVMKIGSCAGYVFAFQLVFYRAPARLAARIALAEMAFGAVLPAGGAGGIAVGAWIAKAKGAPLRRFMQLSAVLFVLTSAVNAGTLVVAGALVATGLLHAPHALVLGLVPAAIVSVGLAGFLVLPRLAGRLPLGVESHRLTRWLHATAQVVRDTVAQLRHPGWRLIGAFAYLWCDIAVLWICFRAFGPATPPLGALILGYQIGYLTNILPVPGGIGVLDGGIVGALVVYGVDPAAAAAAVLLYHAIVLLVPTLLGTIAFLRLRPTLHEPIQLRPERSRG
jgi:uncharacterized membrane protein YbhN (UPF0104 family)